MLANSLKAPKGPGRYWVTKPFRWRPTKDNPDDLESYVGQQIDTILQILLGTNPDTDVDPYKHWADSVEQWRKNPFVPHLVARGRTVAFQKATFMAYLDALIQWGDYLFRRDDRESVNAALQLYITAERLLGPRPRVVKPAKETPSRTFRELERLLSGEGSNIDIFGNSLVILENILPPESDSKDSGKCIMPSVPATASLKKGSYFCIPTNEKLLGYWDKIEDRLFKIRNCQNIDGVERQLALFAPPIDPALLIRAFAAGLSIGDVLAQGAGEQPHYRFQILSQKATELAQMVSGLGSSLLQTIEKKDAEALAKLRSTHEIELLKLTRDMKIMQVQEAENTLLSLRYAKRTTEERRNFYRDVQNISANEGRSLQLSAEGTRYESSSIKLNTAANIAHLIPSFSIGAWGFGGAPGVNAEWGGQHLGQALSAMGQYLAGQGSLKRAAASAVNTLASYERRWEDWKLQERLADRELAQIDRQITAAEIRVEIFEQELKNHDRQTEQSAEVLDYMEDRKFTNEELYDWMISQISSTYYQSWQLAHRFALRAERAFHFELGPKNGGDFPNYIRMDSWDSLHKGLHAGEKLQLDIKRMETDYLDRNRREFEITKHISLLRLNPEAFLALRRGEGTCEFELPEVLFDLDYPGHYFRRLKSVSLSIPCVVGPYAGVHCTLTLTKNKIRTRPDVKEGEDDEQNLLRNFGRIQSVATSSGQNDSGMFEVNFRDDRFLPFEGAGARSTWTLELRKEDNRELAFDTLSDIILHVNYTSRFGGNAYQAARRDATEGALKDLSEFPVRRFMVLSEEFPTEWHRFVNGEKANRVLFVGKDKLKERLPYFYPNKFEDEMILSLHSLNSKENPVFKWNKSEEEELSKEGSKWVMPGLIDIDITLLDDDNFDKNSASFAILLELNPGND